jgi:hypothetical protein
MSDNAIALLLYIFNGIGDKGEKVSDSLRDDDDDDDDYFYFRYHGHTAILTCSDDKELSLIARCNSSS